MPHPFKLEDKDELINNLPHLLCVFSYNGFTSKAEKFAKSHGVVLTDSIKMVDILCT